MIDVRFLRPLIVGASLVLPLATSFAVSYSAEVPRESERLTAPSTVSLPVMRAAVATDMSPAAGLATRVQWTP